MFCAVCGKQIPEGARFCGGCGTPVAANNTPPAPAPAPVTRLYLATSGLTMFNYKFTIKDEYGNDRYLAATVTQGFGYAAKLYAPNQMELFTVQQQKKMTMALMHFDMVVGGQLTTAIRLIVHMTKYSFELPQMGITVDGDFIGHRYQFFRGGQIVASVSRKMMSWGDSYEIEFADSSLEHYLLAATLAIALVTIHNRQRRRR